MGNTIYKHHSIRIIYPIIFLVNILCDSNSTQKKMACSQIGLTLSIILALCFNGWTVNAEEVQTKDLLIEDTLLIYTPEEMLSFNIQDYLQENAPHLTEYAEIISHWSGYSSISPKIIIALLSIH